MNKLDVIFTTGPAPVPATEVDEVDFTIVIAHRGPAMGLWATIHSCELELIGSRFKYNYVIVPNGEEKWTLDQTRIWDFLGKTGKLRDVIKVVKPTSPPSSRNIGAASANGKYIFFFDNHCLVGKNYFARAIESMEKYNIEMLHSMTRFYMGDSDHWHYQLTLKKNFWGGSTLSPMFSTPYGSEPYRCAVAGHGGFAITRQLWKEVGGYWDGFTGYGGEETYFDLKLWMLGKEVWLDPQMIHYHFAGDRGYPRHYTDDYFTNLMMVANIIGGRPWLRQVFENFQHSTRIGKSDQTMFDLYMKAVEYSQQYADILAQKRACDLDSLLLSFDKQKVLY